MKEKNEAMKKIDERLELSEIIGCAVNDWGDFCEECHNDGYLPTDTFEEYIADSVFAKGYRKQSDGEWVAKRHISVSKRNRTIHYETYKCSVCGTWNGRCRQNFCPNCGARMKGGAE